MLHQPLFRMPLWAAAAIVGGAYVARSVYRGLDFKPDMPADAVALVALVVMIGMVWWVRTRLDTADGEGIEADPNDNVVSDDPPAGTSPPAGRSAT